MRTQHKDGSVTVSDTIGVPITPNGNPGIYGVIGPDPRVAIAFHSSSGATGTITLSGSIVAGDVGTITIEDRTYNYTVQATDTLNSVRDSLIALINSSPDEKVIASAGSAVVRIVLTAKVHGPEGNGLAIAATSNNPNTSSPSLSLGVNNTMLCCANVADAPITQDNPALPGETIYLYATGLGLVSDLDGNLIGPLDGAPFVAPPLNTANSTVSSLAAAKTADVIGASLEVGGIGVYKVVLQLNPDLQTGPAGQLTISQDIYTSNIVTIPIGNPAGPFIPRCNWDRRSPFVVCRALLGFDFQGAARNFILPRKVSGNSLRDLPRSSPFRTALQKNLEADALDPVHGAPQERVKHAALAVVHDNDLRLVSARAALLRI